MSVLVRNPEDWFSHIALIQCKTMNQDQHVMSCFALGHKEEIQCFFYSTPQPLYNTIVGVQANFGVSYPICLIMRVKCVDIL